jgi:hypothetical protein
MHPSTETELTFVQNAFYYTTETEYVFKIYNNKSDVIQVGKYEFSYPSDQFIYGNMKTMYEFVFKYTICDSIEIKDMSNFVMIRIKRSNDPNTYHFSYGQTIWRKM